MNAAYLMLLRDAVENVRLAQSGSLSGINLNAAVDKLICLGQEIARRRV